MNRQFIFTIMASVIISGCGKSDIGSNPKDEIIDTIWSTWSNSPNGGYSSSIKYVNVKGILVKKGTVLPSAMDSSVDGRLPAYLACYDFIQVTNLPGLGGGDDKSNMCIYYISNPTTGMVQFMHRGKKYMSTIEQSMAQDDFKPD